METYMLTADGRVVRDFDEGSYKSEPIKKTSVGEARISTVFMPLNHNHYGGEPIVFETMIFCDDDEINNLMWRCGDLAEAKANHETAVELVQHHVSGDAVVTFERPDA